ncbi:MAG: hypothetical protein JO232_06950, partial [Verrucomicrobia bacterium]|nr:hypothetical protein [Verrucomicrobiota bacterium]
MPVSDNNSMVLAATVNTPYVVTDAGAGNDVTVVTTDHEYGACIGTEHLIALGHRRIACISGP